MSNESSERTWKGPNANERVEILKSSTSVAIVGASNNPERASYGVAEYLLANSAYKVYFVNPRADEILGAKAYASLADLPEVPDIVDVFRRHEDLPEVAREAVKAGAKTLWLQLGSWNEEAAAIAEDADLKVVMDRCIKVEHTRFRDEL